MSAKCRILECDIGNSRCKWRVIDSDLKVLERGVFDHSSGFSSLPDLEEVTRIRVATVAAKAVLEQFKDHTITGPIRPEFARTAEQSAGVVNTYEDPTRLGVDRWLEAVAAYKDCNGAAVIIDAGSALNIELVSQQGEYLGGYIAPGAEMMKRALLSDTGQVRFNNRRTRDLSFGKSTQAAVSGGVFAALVGASRVAIEQAKVILGDDVSIFVTGGDASVIAGYLNDRVIERPDLVLDGLRWVLP